MTLEEWLGKDNTLGHDIWQKKYQYNNETLDEWFDRVSGGDEAVKQLIKEKKFLFGGRILANRGLAKDGRKITYSNCYVLSPPEDNIESIFDTAKKLARTFSYGGGVGIDIGKLSPYGAKINNAAKETSGAVSFMDLYSMVTGLIGQAGRRGALMISIPCNHPDLLDFIDIKSDLNRVTKANISVRITDDFMVAAKNGWKYLLEFTRDETGETIVKEVDAREVFKKLCEENWNNAEPGMLFWDTIRRNNILSNDESFEYAGTNPCAEEPLPAGGSCLLGSLNLAEFIDEEKKVFDFESFRRAVAIATKALNDVLDEGMKLHPLEEQRTSVNEWRQIGLGIFGLADAMIKMGVRYGSVESIDLCDAIGSAMADQAIYTSATLANKYGEYPRYKHDKVMNSSWLNKNIIRRETKGWVQANGLRNSQLLTCAPTGSLSSMFGVSGGIEPIFANYYTRKTETLHGHDEYYKVYTPIVKKYMDEHGLKDDSELPSYFVTAQTLDYKDRIEMQAVWQKHIDASISSTINLPNSATIEDVENIYMRAWEKGLKGVTIFRDGCRRIGILTTENKNEKAGDNSLRRGEVVAASDDLVGKKRKLITGCGSLHCEAFFDPETGELRETYLSKGSTGGCNSFMIGLSRLISLAARGGLSVESIVDQLNSCTSCPSYAVRRATHHDTSKGNCCPMAVGNALMEMSSEMKKELESGKKTPTIISVSDKQSVDKDTDTKCPECGGKLYHEGGCIQCKDCGWTRCD